MTLVEKAGASQSFSFGIPGKNSSSSSTSPTQPTAIFSQSHSALPSSQTVPRALSERSAIEQALPSASSPAGQQIALVNRVIKNRPPISLPSSERPDTTKIPIRRVSLGGKDTYEIHRRPSEIKGLVFSGGGSKGLAYAGVMEALRQSAILKDVKYVTGSSAGAMTAMMIALGIDEDNFTEIVKALDFAQLLSFFERDTDGVCHMADSGENVVKLLQEIIRRHLEVYLEPDRDFLLSKEEYLNKQTDFNDRRQAEHNYERVMQRFRAFLTEPTADFTYADLHHLQAMMKDYNKHRIKDLNISVSDLTTGKLREFSYELTPHASIASTVQIAGALPGVFRPQTWEDGHILADTGIINNTPVKTISSKVSAASSLIFVFSTHSDPKSCDLHRSLRTSLPITPKVSDIIDRVSVWQPYTLFSIPSIIGDALSDSAASGAGWLLAQALSGQNVVENDKRLYEELRDIAPRVVIIDTLSHGISTTTGLIPGSTPASKSAKEQCIRDAYEATRAHVKELRENAAWTVETYDSLKDAVAALKPGEKAYFPTAIG